MFYLTTHSTHFIYSYTASDTWLRTILIVRKETRCRHIDYSFRLAASVLLSAPSHRQDRTFVTPVVEHWLEREIGYCVECMLKLEMTKKDDIIIIYIYFFIIIFFFYRSGRNRCSLKNWSRPSWTGAWTSSFTRSRTYRRHCPTGWRLDVFTSKIGSVPQ